MDSLGGVYTGASINKDGSMGLCRSIWTDVKRKAVWRYQSGSVKSIVKVLLADGTFAMIIYRLMQFCGRNWLGPLAAFFNKLNLVCGGCIIGRKADFGPGFVLLHSIGTVINTGVKGGQDILLEHQVTIGGDHSGCPVLGDDIYVGCGAKILGAIRIGTGVRIGANAVVVEDVPDYCTVGGIPARVLRRRAHSDLAHPCLNYSEDSERQQ